MLTKNRLILTKRGTFNYFSLQITLRLSIQSARAEGTVQTRYRVSGKGQLKEQAGFLVS